MVTRYIPLSNNSKAAARVEAHLARGAVLTAYSALDRATITVGPYTPAVGPRGLFAVYAHGRGAPGPREGLTAAEAAAAFNGRVGAGRAREAAIARDRLDRLGYARVTASVVRGRRFEAPIVTYDTSRSA